MCMCGSIQCVDMELWTWRSDYLSCCLITTLHLSNFKPSGMEDAHTDDPRSVFETEQVRAITAVLSAIRAGSKQVQFKRPRGQSTGSTREPSAYQNPRTSAHRANMQAGMHDQDGKCGGGGAQQRAGSALGGRLQDAAEPGVSQGRRELHCRSGSTGHGCLDNVLPRQCAAPPYLEITPLCPQQMFSHCRLADSPVPSPHRCSAAFSAPWSASSVCSSASCSTPSTSSPRHRRQYRSPIRGQMES